MQLQDRCRFKLEDYRNETGPFDRIVSVGCSSMSRLTDEFFGKLRDLLADDGVCVIHSIGRFDQPSRSIPLSQYRPSRRPIPVK